jgi:hypothetical protein
LPTSFSGGQLLVRNVACPLRRCRPRRQAMKATIFCVRRGSSPLRIRDHRHRSSRDYTFVVCKQRFERLSRASFTSSMSVFVNGPRNSTVRSCAADRRHVARISMACRQNRREVRPRYAPCP